MNFLKQIKPFLYFIFALPLFCLGNLTAIYAQPTIQSGVLDIRNYNFEEHDYLTLNGEWEFYWKELLTNDELNHKEIKNYREVTSLWNQDYTAIGYATYKLTILLPENAPSLSLEVPDVYSSYELYSSSRLIAHNGKVATSKEQYTPRWATEIIPIQHPKSDTLTLVLQIANFDHNRGGSYKPILLGKSSTLALKRNSELTYSFILTGALLITSFFFFGLYIFGRREKAIIYFSLFCLFYGYRIVGTSYYALHSILPNLPWIFTTHLEYFSLFLSGLFFGLYTLHLFPKETSKTLMYTLSGISIFGFLVTLIFPPLYFSKLVIPYSIVLIAYIIYAFWTYIKAALKNRVGAYFALASTGIGFLVFMYEIIVYLGHLNDILFFTAAGYIIFFIFQSLVLIYRFSISMKEATVKAESASKAKSQFLSTMSHEIRTPLNAIIGLSDLLYQTPLNNTQEDYVKTVKLSGENLLSIINNILDYSKIESSRIDIQENEVSIQELIENVIDIITPLNSKTEVDLIYNIDDSVPPYLQLDGIKFQQILINIINNAIKFTDKGEVYVELKYERSKLLKNPSLIVKIRDTGIGIHKKSIKLLFSSFSQVDSSTTRKYGGTGLGLAISKRLIEALGGNITVTSEVNVGTEFNFFIKVKESDKKTPLRKSKILNGKSVLYLDDNKLNLQIFETLAAKQGLKVTTSSDYHFINDNIETLNRFDIVVLDMHMPDKTGEEIARQIRAVWNNKDLKLVLLCSIFDKDNGVDSSLFDALISKPIKHSLLFKNFEQLFTSSNNQNQVPKQVASTSARNLEAQILVAEDNIFNQKVALRMLERLGYAPIIVENGKEAIDAVTDNEIDIILMDVEMPIIDGVEATITIRELEHTLSKRPTIIAMTANAMNEDKIRCFKAGMDDFITKPISIDLLDKTLTKWLNK